MEFMNNIFSFVPNVTTTTTAEEMSDSEIKRQVFSAPVSFQDDIPAEKKSESIGTEKNLLSQKNILIGNNPKKEMSEEVKSDTSVDVRDPAIVQSDTSNTKKVPPKATITFADAFPVLLNKYEKLLKNIDDDNWKKILKTEFDKFQKKDLNNEKQIYIPDEKGEYMLHDDVTRADIENLKLMRGEDFEDNKFLLLDKEGVDFDDDNYNNLKMFYCSMKNLHNIITEDYLAKLIKNIKEFAKEIVDEKYNEIKKHEMSVDHEINESSNVYQTLETAKTEFDTVHGETIVMLNSRKENPQTVTKLPQEIDNNDVKQFKKFIILSEKENHENYIKKYIAARKKIIMELRKSCNCGHSTFLLDNAIKDDKNDPSTAIFYQGGRKNKQTKKRLTSANRRKLTKGKNARRRV